MLIKTWRSNVLVKEAAEQNHLYLSSPFPTLGTPSPLPLPLGTPSPLHTTCGVKEPASVVVPTCPNSLNQPRQLDLILAPLPHTIASRDTI